MSDDNIEDLLLYAAQTRYPRRNRVIALLSVKAGLRAGEIAKLTWEMVIAPDGTINTVIELRNHAAKKGSGRLIPIHADLRDALIAWRKLTDGRGPVIRSERGERMVPGEHRAVVQDRLSRTIFVGGRMHVSRSRIGERDISNSPEVEN